MRLPDFALERHFARWEFVATHLLCSSDVEGMRLAELLALADDDAKARWESLSLGYTEAPGLPALRAEIARLYDGVEPEEVYTFAGAQEAIFIALNLLVGPGDHAIVTWPGYQSLYEVARSAGAEVTLLPLEAERDWAFDLDALRRALRPNTRVVVTNFPHNPTGALPDRRTFEELIAICDDAGVTLLSDEVYRWSEHDPADRLPAAVERSRRALSVGVLSKSFGLAGLRIGWLATHDRDLLARAAAFKDYTSIGNSAPSEVLGLIALRARDRVLARTAEILRPNLALLDAFFARVPEVFTWSRPRAGTIGFPRLRPDWPADAFCDELVRSEGVLLLPGSVYGHEGNHVRFGFGRRNLPESLERLERFVARRGRGT